MAEAFVGEIRIFGTPWAPRGWAPCNGQLLPVSQNVALFSVLGTTYGGDGRTNFALPDLQGSVPVQQGAGPGLTPRSLGERGGQATVTLTNDQIPSHTHVPQGVAANGNTGSPADATWAQPVYGRGATRSYSTSVPDTVMHPQALSSAGGGQPHNNMPPYLVVNYCIALWGIYPSRP